MSVSKAISRSRGVIATARQNLVQVKANGGDIGSLIGPGPGVGQLGGYRDRAANTRRYELNRGWVHAAINALAQEGAEQDVYMGRVKGADVPGSPKRRKRFNGNVYVKDARNEVEKIEVHPFLDSLEKPNPVQYRWQFVYSFISNICLTGWGYIVGDYNDSDQYEFYCLPTTWVEPIHDPHPFAKFKIRNPNNPTEDPEPLDASQVRFAFIPNPANPLAASSLAGSQMSAIRIDEYIQTSQTAFFQNGIFPSVVVTVGQDPHPHAPGGKGIRPRLTPAQRRAVYSAIRKVSGGVANYGNPAIVDGLIESITRMSATQNEMGWEKSEKAIRTRILSAFGVHPYILGEEIAGSYAQAYNVEKRFYRRVNSFLDMLSLVMTDFASSMVEANHFVWWEPCQAENPDLKQKAWDAARKNDDVSQNEYREAVLNLPPDEDGNQAILPKAVVQAVIGVAASVSAGKMTVEQGVGILVGLGAPDDLAKRIAGKGKIETPEDQQAQALLEQQQTDQLEEVAKMLQNPIKIDFDSVEQRALEILGA